MTDDSSALPETPPMEVLLRQQQEASRSQPCDLTRRLRLLSRLLQAILANQQLLVSAVSQDFGHRNPNETRLLEIVPLVDEIRHIRRHLRRWMKPRSVRANWQFLPSRARVMYQPLGVVGVISPWNYPVLLALSPLANALGAGNRVMVKTSELAPATAAVIQRMLASCFASQEVAVVTGDADTAARFAALPFDHLLFTGSTRVGRKVAQAAAAHLTPVTLELGGKSPALVHPSFPLAAAADRICSAKLWNAGQTCVAPDYVMLPSAQVDDFVREAGRSIRARWGSGGDATWLLDAAACERMDRLLEDARAQGARIISMAPEGAPLLPGSRAFPPTLVVGVHEGMQLMQEEIFGPILPIEACDTMEQAMARLAARPRPLALYYFDNDRQRIDAVLQGTVSGGVTVNDCIFHLAQHGLPFGGVGPSGQGAYHGFDGFETFSHKKGVLLQHSLVAWVFGKLTKPPYGRHTRWLNNLLIGR